MKKSKEPDDYKRTDEDKFTAARIVGLLMEKHQKTGDVVFFDQIPNSTGYGKERTIDAFAMELWPSKKFARTAYEVKVSRGDWLNELSQPEKRDPFMKLSNWFYYVAPVGLVDVASLPEGCGLLEADKGGLKIRRAAPWRDVGEIPLEFVASLMRAKKAEKFTGEDIFLFKYAGREMNQEDLKELLNQARGADTEHEIRKRVQEEMADWKKEQPGHQIVSAILKEMNRSVEYNLDMKPKEIRDWLRDQRMGVPAHEVDALKHSAETLARGLDIILKRQERRKKERDDDDGSGGAAAPDAGPAGPSQHQANQDPNPKGSEPPA
jgi:hypothetical protein